MIFEQIHFQRHPDGGVYLVGKWPRYARLMTDMLYGSNFIEINEAGQIRFVLKNSSATYKLIKQKQVGAPRYFGVLDLERVQYIVVEEGT
jgi:hypothetical protein